LIRRERPHALFLDVHLRQLNGFDLLHLLRKDSELGRTRVLMASGMDLTVQTQLQGADDFILKPFMPDELVSKIQHMLESEL
jgi:DNA-binding response OmpR family regulator